jgi:hypothetical protein
MDSIFNEALTEPYQELFADPFDADWDTNHRPTQCHFLRAHFIFNNQISPSSQVEIKHNIDCFYFVYVDFGNERWDDKYWFCIGKTKDKRFFSYESTCSGTGFGLGSSTTIYYAKDENVLLTYGIEDKHRAFIEQHPKKIFLRLAGN